MPTLAWIPSTVIDTNPSYFLVGSKWRTITENKNVQKYYLIFTEVHKHEISYVGVSYIHMKIVYKLLSALTEHLEGAKIWGYALTINLTKST
jgi:hypothetical protein